MTLIIKRIIFGIFIMLWMILIFVLSAQTAPESAELSGGLLDKILNIFNKKLSDYDVFIIDFMQFIIRKSAHTFLYIVLSILVLVELSLFNVKREIIFTSIISVLYAISDEIHQYFVPGRSGEIRDVIVDTIGVVIGIIIVKIVRKMYK